MKEILDKKYGPGFYVTSASQSPNRTMAILEMLTGYDVELKSKADYLGLDNFKKEFPSSPREAGVDPNAYLTIVYDKEHGMRPIRANEDVGEMSGKGYHLLDCRVGLPTNQANIRSDSPYFNRWRPKSRTMVVQGDYKGSDWQEAYDRFWEADTVYSEMVWVLRLANQQKLALSDIAKKLNPLRPSFDKYFYQDGVLEEYITEPTQSV